jgi:hypothetical protein
MTPRKEIEMEAAKRMVTESDPEAVGEAIAASASETSQLEPEKRYTMAELHQMARDILADAPEYVSQISACLAEVVEGLRIGDDRRAMERYTVGLGCLQDIITFLQIASTVSPGLAGRARVAEFTGMLERVGGELVSAQNTGDLTLVADLIEYELGPALATWAAVQTEIAETLSA